MQTKEEPELSTGTNLNQLPSYYKFPQTESILIIPDPIWYNTKMLPEITQVLSKVNRKCENVGFKFKKSKYNEQINKMYSI